VLNDNNRRYPYATGGSSVSLEGYWKVSVEMPYWPCLVLGRNPRYSAQIFISKHPSGRINRMGYAKRYVHTTDMFQQMYLRLWGYRQEWAEKLCNVPLGTSLSIKCEYSSWIWIIIFLSLTSKTWYRIKDRVNRSQFNTERRR
jgi:hypothetical protein